jgi:hypothetical protein
MGKGCISFQENIVRSLSWKNEVLRICIDVQAVAARSPTVCDQVVMYVKHNRIAGAHYSSRSIKMPLLKT